MQSSDVNHQTGGDMKEERENRQPQYCDVTFHVVIQQNDVRGGYVSIRGSIPELGGWEYSNIRFTQSEYCKEDWFTTIRLPFAPNARSKWNETLFEYK